LVFVCGAEDAVAALVVVSVLNTVIPIVYPYNPIYQKVFKTEINIHLELIITKSVLPANNADYTANPPNEFEWLAPTIFPYVCLRETKAMKPRVLTHNRSIDEYLHELGYSVDALTSSIQVYSSISAIVIYLAYLVADIVLASLMKKNAAEYQDEDTREEFFARHPGARGGAPYTRRDDVESTFEDFENSHTNKKKDDDHVFDEFDI